MAICDFYSQEIRSRDGYHLCTREVLASRHYCLFFLAHYAFEGDGKTLDASTIDQVMAASVSEKGPWFACGTCIHLFTIDRAYSKGRYEMQTTGMGDSISIALCDLAPQSAVLPDGSSHLRVLDSVGFLAAQRFMRVVYEELFT